MSINNSPIGQINLRLNDVVEEFAGGNASVFAEKSDINIKTFHTYLKGRTPSVDALFRICRKYNINLNWLVAGIGHKYITDQGESGVFDPDPKIAELMEGAGRILTSGNNVALDALKCNIRYFDYVIRQEKRIIEMEKRLSALEGKKDL